MVNSCMLVSGGGGVGWGSGGGSGPMVKVLWTVWAGVGPWFERLLLVCQSSVVPCLSCSLSIRLTVCLFCSPFRLSYTLPTCLSVCLVPGLSACLSCSLSSYLYFLFPVYLVRCLSVCLSVCLSCSSSVCLVPYPSVCLVPCVYVPAVGSCGRRD